MNDQPFPTLDNVRTKVVDDEGNEVEAGVLEETPETPSTDSLDIDDATGNVARFKIQNEDELTLDNLFMNGCLEGEILLTKTISARYRTLSAEESQDIEGSVSMDGGRSYRYLNNEVSLGQLVKSITKMGNTQLPEDEEARAKLVRGMPSFYVNLLLSGYNFFMNHCRGLLERDAIENF